MISARRWSACFLRKRFQGGRLGRRRLGQRVRRRRSTAPGRCHRPIGPADHHYAAVPGRASESLDEAGLRGHMKVMVGGAPVSRALADEVGADGFAADCVSAVDEARRLTC